MDKLARLVGMDPMEFRILNAYRDGDMKAHRRVTKNAALIECVQAAAQLADWPLSERFRAMASTRDGGGERAVVPPTPTATTPRPAPSAAAPEPSPPQKPESEQSTPARSPLAGAGRMSSLLGSRRR